MRGKTYCVYKYVWEDGYYYIGRTSTNNIQYRRYGNDKQYSSQYVYKKMCSSPYKKKICFESDNIFKVYWLEHKCIRENWNLINCLNGSTEEKWINTAIKDCESQDLKTLASMMIECENWIEGEGKDLVNKILNYNWENIEESLNSDYVERKLF